MLFVTGMYPTHKYPARGLSVKPQVDALRKTGVAVDVLFFDGRSSWLNYGKGVLETARRATAKHYDVVHGHYVFGGLVARCQPGLPVVVSFCGSDVMQLRTRWLSKVVARLADAVIVKSKRLGQALGYSSAHVIPNGVDFELFRPIAQEEARQRLNLDSQRQYVLFIGNRDSAAKRFDRAEAAWNILQQSLADDRAELLALHGRQVPHEQIPYYMNAADVLLMTSDWEGSPNVIKEAMACNLPIVTTDVGDVREVIGDTLGCFVSEREPAIIAGHLADALAFGRRTNGRERIDWLRDTRVIQRLIGVYDEVRH